MNIIYLKDKIKERQQIVKQQEPNLLKTLFIEFGFVCLFLIVGISVFLFLLKNLGWYGADYSDEERSCKENVCEIK